MPKTSGPRSISATTLTGTVFELQVSGAEDGQDLLELLVQAGFNDYEPSRVRMVWDGKDLCDDVKTLDELAIPDGATLMIFRRHDFELRLLGGAGAEDEARRGKSGIIRYSFLFFS